MDELQRLQQRLNKVLEEPPIVPSTTRPDVAIEPTEDTHTLEPTPLAKKYIAQVSNWHSIIAESDLEGNITYVNDNFIRISKYSREELIGAPHSLLRSGFHPDSFYKRMWKTIQAGKIWRGTIKNKAKDGSYYWVKTLIAPVKNQSGQIVKYIAIRTDVTSILEASANQSRLESKIRSIEFLNRLYDLDRNQQSLPVILNQGLAILFEAPFLKILSKGGVFLADNNSRELNLVASFHLGQDIERLCKKVCFGHCLCGRAAQTKKLVFAQCIDHRHEVSFEGMAPHGHYNVPILVGGELIGVLVVYLEHGTKRDPNHEEFLGEFAQALGVIISFKQREEQLVQERQKSEAVAIIANKATLDAQAAEQAKTNFLATMSHELRTPLNGVVGMLHAVKLSELTQEQTEDIDVAMHSADMLLKLINDILDFSKFEYGSMQLDLLPVDIRQLTKDFRSSFAMAALEKGLELQAHVADDFPQYCLGDPTRLRQISSNLVGNAIKFTNQGLITVTTEFCEAPTGKSGGVWAITKVTDTGIGMPESALQLIFKRFNQADNTVTRKFGGTGLGLAICKQLVELMGGEIGVTSTEGKGTCFWYKLPTIAVDATGKTLAK
ncbi:MAG: hypothetical protein COA47_10850 [Robiginitomaculum sp.]|nr:MAG: hypothetical protein COA47_10850 [Robiginitomaculum sp.]